MHGKVAGALVVALALALASCGGSSTLSKADFVKQANAACAKARKDAEKARGKGIAGFADRVEQYANEKTKGIEALKPPDELKASYTEYTGVLKQRSDLISRLVVSLKARKRISKPDEKAVAELQRKEESAARALGLTTCLENQGAARH